MAVRWPDGSFTGSVLATPAPAPVEPEPEEPETTVPEVTVPTEKSDDKKGVPDGAR